MQVKECGKGEEDVKRMNKLILLFIFKVSLFACFHCGTNVLVQFYF